jgi:ABC-type multidrug transport system ATPase subunit
MDAHFQSGERYALLGPNGSGKSTLLKLISGYLSPSEGTIQYQVDGHRVESSEVYKHMSVAAPYVDLIEEFTLLEVLHLHVQFRQLLPDWDLDRVLDLIQLPQAKNKSLKFFSSGMRQRVKLALACLTRSECLMLDEPTSNLDRQAIQWYHDLLQQTSDRRILMIFSNQPEEYQSCTVQMNLSSFKDFRPSKQRDL